MRSKSFWISNSEEPISKIILLSKSLIQDALITAGPFGPGLSGPW